MGLANVALSDEMFGLDFWGVNFLYSNKEQERAANVYPTF